MKHLIFAAAAVIAVFGATLWFTAAAQAAPTPPSQCTGIYTTIAYNQNTGVASITGGDENNFIVGTGSSKDTIRANGGNDCIVPTYSGPDYIDGGPGYDICFAGPGDTVVNCEEVYPKVAPPAPACSWWLHFFGLC